MCELDTVIMSQISYTSNISKRKNSLHRKKLQILSTNTKAIIPVSSRGAKKIPSLCSEQAVRSRNKRLRLPRFARNDGLAHPFRARNDNAKIYIVFILEKEER